MSDKKATHASKETESDRNKTDNLELEGVSLSGTKRMDSSWYEKKYPEMKFMWIPDTGGEVEKYLRAGAEIQKDESTEQFSGETHGFKSKGSNGYVSVIAGTDHGVPYEQILLKMTIERYQKMVIDPKESKNQAIRDAMGDGIASADDLDGSNLKTYAATTHTGGKGFEQIAGKAGFNQLVNK